MTTRDEHDRDGEQGDEEEDLEECVDREDKRAEAGEEGHALDEIAKEAELEFESGLKCTKSPAGALLEVTSEGVGDSSELQCFVAECGLPAGSEKK